MLFNSGCLLAAALVMSAEAFAPSSTSSRACTLHATLAEPTTSSNGQTASDKPLTSLCEITKEACEAVTPMLNGKWMNIA
jgi:hypothetical protein